MSTAAAIGGAPEQFSTGHSPSSGREQPLDEVMLAMDVVDTLRRRERLVQRELDVEGREEDLKNRLRKIYSAQGIDVPDQVIEDGVRALREDRFVYTPRTKGLSVRLAHWYVNRDKWGKWVLAGLAALVLAVVLYNVMVAGPNRALPGELSEVNQTIQQLSATDPIKAQAQTIFDNGQVALRNDDVDAARLALSDLRALELSLSQEYNVRIVNEQGERSGVWRIPDVNTQARNYYIIVEALDASGNLLSVPIKSEETGQTELVSRWGLRVDESTFEAIAADKQDNGIIENNNFGFKRRGYLQPDYELPTSGGAITQW